MCSQFGHSGLFTLELPALLADNTIFELPGMLDSGERSLPFGRLVKSGWLILAPILNAILFLNTGSLKTYLASLYIHRFQRFKNKYNVFKDIVNLLIFALLD